MHCALGARLSLDADKVEQPCRRRWFIADRRSAPKVFNIGDGPSRRHGRNCRSCAVFSVRSPQNIVASSKIAERTSANF